MGDDPTRTLEGPGPLARKSGRPVLAVVSGADGERFTIPTGGFVIGRGDEADGRLQADGVSRRHAKVLDHGDGLVNLLDLGSTNGTFLNGRRVDAAVLREGDEVRIGQVVLRFTYDDDVPDAASDAPARRPNAPPIADLLTARELEVARLVARGLTNAEIGKQLFISARTVSTHLANIYERLGIHTRAALAAHVVHHDLGSDEP
ncbi:MAG TPA: LuxR C-terminal-related transcriptional regulator [Nannocystaceae bacterium]|nr:LuxR C-terminal-related transcriptional regulator [Nannocystaceae bacterium]